MKYLGLVLCTVVAFHACVVVSGLDDRDQITQETLEEVYKKLSPHCVDEVQNQGTVDGMMVRSHTMSNKSSYYV